MTGCKKDPVSNLSNDETRIYITNYDTTVNFSTYKTFSIDDSVAVIQDNQLQGRQLTGFDNTVISQVIKDMQQKGFTQVARENNPDLAINVSEVSNTSTGVFSYDNYWNSYDMYYDPSYWGYAGYDYYSPYAVGVYTIQQGGLTIDMFDLKNASANGNKIRDVWSGLARGEEVFSPTNATSETDALFLQSPYL